MPYKGVKAGADAGRPEAIERHLAWVSQVYVSACAPIGDCCKGD